uniref:NADH-ubiquinone oxidoreductase chain 2 n=1 Tax=Runaria punctata TaxID=2950364 RepID=A0A977TL17_9HYME|nr:NADH dehydrogenase subunit 2 [Runaria punctata]UXW93347.1 NADH dehydrogenase subunit 2 [Runaria punctata]
MTKMNNKLKFMLYFTLIFSTIMAISSNSWMSMWMSLEINMMSFIPLLINKSMHFSSNTMIKYFLTQASSSSLLIISLMMMKTFPFSNQYMNSLMTLSLLFKLGASPFHWWMPSMINEMSWLNCLILLSWQKIIPLYMINLMEYKSILINVCASLSALMGSISGLNQTSLKMIMVYSSITHTGWMIYITLINKKMLIMYLITYMSLIMTITMTCKTMKLMYLTQMFMMNNKNIMLKMMMMMSFLSLSGLPPLLGFMPKIFTLILMMNNNMIIEPLILMMSTLISLKFYMNPMITTLMLNSTNTKQTPLFKFNYISLIIIINMLMNLILIKYFNQIMI